MRRGKTRDIVLGGPELSLAEARLAAAQAKDRVRRGQDPAPRAKVDLTLGHAVREWIDYAAGGWRSTTEHGHATNQHEHHFGHLYRRDIGTITRTDIVETLKPVWANAATASKLLSRISRVFDRAMAMDLVATNPADPKIIRNLLPRIRHVKEHHPAVPVADPPATYARLANRTNLAAYCLRLIVLTAGRSGEARRARWTEFDLDAAVWTIPEDRTKTGKELRVV